MAEKFARMSRAEVEEMTGTPQKARQIKFLRLNGIKHYVGLDGRPCVPRSVIDGNAANDATRTWKSNKAS